jgi:hypothetical protein
MLGTEAGMMRRNGAQAMADGSEEQMGIEYRLRFNAPTAEAVAGVLRRVDAACEAPPPEYRFDLGIAASDRGWPQATVQVESDGAYFCDHGGASGRALLGEVVARLVSAFGAVTIDVL